MNFLANHIDYVSRFTIIQKVNRGFKRLSRRETNPLMTSCRRV